MEKIIIFGIGRAYRNLRGRLEFNYENVEIVALIDNDKSKQGKIIDGVRVYPPEEALKLDYQYILVLGIYMKEMQEQLNEYGIDESKIVLGNNLGAHAYWFKARDVNVFCGNDKLSNVLGKMRRKPIILFGSLIYAGGPLALLRMAQILKKNNLDVIVVVGEDGPALKEYTRSDITVVIDRNISLGIVTKNTWLTNASTIVVNGVQAAPLIENLPHNLHIIWWLHDPEDYYVKMGFDFGSMSLKNVDVYAVSDKAWEPIKKRFPYLPKKLLRYGIPEMKAYNDNESFKEKLIFAVLGKVHCIKGQDIFLDAVLKMKEEYRNQCEFWVIGNTDDKFADEIRKKAETLQNFKFKGEYDREGINKLYAQISVVVTPSRADMLPTVNVEAAMHKIPCIITENAGTASFIEDGINGLIMKGNDSRSLAEKMEWAVINKDQLKKMGKAGRRIYEENFTMDTFEKNVINIVNSTL